MKIITAKLLKKSFVLLWFTILALPVSAQRGTDPSVWDGAMERFAEQDRTNPPKMGGIVLTGSSSIARWNDQAAKALARGEGQVSTFSLCHYSKDLLKP